MKKTINANLQKAAKKAENVVDTASHKAQIAGNNLKDLTAKAVRESKSKASDLEAKSDSFIDRAKKTISEDAGKVKDFIKKIVP